MKTEYFGYLIMLKQAGSINKSATMLHTSPQNVSRIMRANRGRAEYGIV